MGAVTVARFVMGNLFDTGIRPLVDDYLQKKSEEVRDYGEYWSASSAGYCQRKLIFERLGVPRVTPIDARTTRVFEAGHIFHQWLQEITQKAGVSLAQEVELQDEDLKVRGHFDDLVRVDTNIILYDYKTQNSRAFNYKRPEMSHYHKMQLGTYMYMLRKQGSAAITTLEGLYHSQVKALSEARILKIDKDALRMSEEQLMWTPDLEKEVVGYWRTLNGYWKAKTIPACTCADFESGFMAKPQYNPFYYKEQPCSLDWYREWEDRREYKKREHDDKFKA